MNRLKKQFNEKVVSELVKEFKFKSSMQTPKITKIMVNAGIGSFRENREAVDAFVTDLTMLTGQKPSPRGARLSIASFKIRQNDTVGYTVTLRGDRMWAFLDKFINVALPRVRDFRGLKTTAFDENGSYSVGIKEHAIFPEVNPNAIRGTRSLQVTIAISGNNKEASKKMLTELGMPFQHEDEMAKER